MTNGVHKVYRLDKQPFAQIPRQAIRDPRITPNAFRLLAYLMSHQDGYDLSYGQIERETGMGRFAINGGIAVLEGLGWLETKPTKLPNGQFGVKAFYVMNPHTSTSVGNSTAVDSAPEQPTDNKNKNKDNKTKENNYPQDKLEEAFNNFWAVYPRKVDKLAGMKAFEKATGKVSPQVLIDSARRLANDPYLPPKQFIPYPASWLNAGGWENEPYPERELTPAEKEAKKKADDEARYARREIELAASKERLERERIEAEKARATVRICEHDRIIHVCKKCNFGQSNTPAS